MHLSASSLIVSGGGNASSPWREAPALGLWRTYKRKLAETAAGARPKGREGEVSFVEGTSMVGGALLAAITSSG